MSWREMALIVSVAAMSWASSATADPTNIVVVGTAEVRTPPDVAKLSFSVKGEGATPDQATAQLVGKVRAIEEGLSALPKAKLSVAASQMNVSAARADDCREDYGNDARLSTGKCAITGYVSTVDLKAVVSPSDQAGTAVGFASSLGAENAAITSFELTNHNDPEKRALAAALADARAKASAIAEGSGGTLGALLSVKDSNADNAVDTDEITVTATRRAPPALQPRPPVVVTLKPEPVSTSARVIVTYAFVPNH